MKNYVIGFIIAALISLVLYLYLNSEPLEVKENKIKYYEEQINIIDSTSYTKQQIKGILSNEWHDMYYSRESRKDSKENTKV